MVQSLLLAASSTEANVMDIVNRCAENDLHTRKWRPRHMSAHLLTSLPSRLAKRSLDSSSVPPSQELGYNKGPRIQLSGYIRLSTISQTHMQLEATCATDINDTNRVVHGYIMTYCMLSTIQVQYHVTQTQVTHSMHCACYALCVLRLCRMYTLLKTDSCTLPALPPPRSLPSSPSLLSRSPFSLSAAFLFLLRSRLVFLDSMSLFFLCSCS